MIGITERGDAFFHKEWINKMDRVDAAVIISKGLPKEILQFKDKVIFHATTTGFGGTVVEPNVAPFIDRLDELARFCKTEGFPKEQVVIRVDPIIATDKGLDLMRRVMIYAIVLEFKRIRYSFMDMYPHVEKRFVKAGLPIPRQNLKAGLAIVNEYSQYVRLESCAEKNEHQAGCISKYDLDLLNVNISLSGSSTQRSTCMCPSQKTELLEHRGRCSHNCLYCYWK